MRQKQLLITLGVVALAALPQAALAATGGGGGLPWEGPLQTLSGSLTGPVATSIALIAIAVAGGVLIWGGEINRFASMAVYIVLVLGLLVMANNVLTTLYTSGMVIPESFANMPSITTPLNNV